MSGAPLVMTSGNVSDEPIAYRDDDALERLGPIADLFLLHDRPIHMRADDSVVRAVAAAAAAAAPLARLRAGERSTLPRRGRAPGARLRRRAEEHVLPGQGRAGVGGPPHRRPEATTRRCGPSATGSSTSSALFAVAPEVVAHDLHPDYLSTAYALEREGVELVAVQHHHAHLAACLAEHGEIGPAVGAIYDGSGFGPDGTVWGGELLVGDLRRVRAGRPPAPGAAAGGDQAVREPWRMACAWLVEALDVDEPPVPAALRDAVDDARWRTVAGMARRGVMAPATTSAGRLFDAVAALCGLRATVTYEGQAAAELEALPRPVRARRLPAGRGRRRRVRRGRDRPRGGA